MKPFNITLTILFFSISSSLFAATQNQDSIVVDTNRIDLFVLKVSKNMIGSQVVVSHSDGEVISTATLKRKRMQIDFDKVKFGLYTIQLMKDGVEVESFTYNKELIISQVIR